MNTQVVFDRVVEDTALNGKYAVFEGAGKVALFEDLETAKAFAQESSKLWGHVQTLVVRIEAQLQTVKIIGKIESDDRFVETSRSPINHPSLATAYQPKFEDQKWKNSWLPQWGEKPGWGAPANETFGQGTTK